MNYAFYHVGSWRDGQAPALKNNFIVVSHDQKNDVYAVNPLEHSDFLSWVANKWGRNDESQGDEEGDEDYLARIGVTLRKLSWS
jgi:hypothetical protein